MNKKILIPVIIIIVGVIFIWWFLKQQASDDASTQTNNSQTSQSTEEPAATNSEAQTPAPEPVVTPPKTNPSGGTFSGEEDIVAPDISVFEVTYDGSSFSPESLTVKAGDVVFFKNNSSSSFRPASDPHPTHTAYAGFDAGSSIPVGGKFEFKFAKVGTWGYHDHLNSSTKGTIIVTN